jgi:hypothetical protein
VFTGDALVLRDGLSGLLRMRAEAFEDARNF